MPYRRPPRVGRQRHSGGVLFAKQQKTGVRASCTLQRPTFSSSFRSIDNDLQASKHFVQFDWWLARSSQNDGLFPSLRCPLLFLVVSRCPYLLFVVGRYLSSSCVDYPCCPFDCPKCAPFFKQHISNDPNPLTTTVLRQVYRGLRMINSYTWLPDA